MMFGERLRALRKQAHLTQEAVAKTLRIHRTTYNRYEAGSVAPDQQGLVQLAEMFGVTVDYLLGCERVVDGLSDSDSEMVRLNAQEKLLVQIFRQLTDEERQELHQRIQQEYHLSRRKKKK